MISFETEVKRRIRIQAIKAIGVATLVVLVIAVNLVIYGSLEALDTTKRYVLIGLFIGGELSSIQSILRYRQILKTPETLKEFQIKENDERNRAIILKTCRTTLNLTSILLGVAGLVASFFSQTVLLTIAVILIGILLLYGTLAIYYARKY